MPMTYKYFQVFFLCVKLSFYDLTCFERLLYFKYLIGVMVQMM